MSNPATYQIHALCQGWRECDASHLLYLTDIGRPARLPYFFWILVPEAGSDTGGSGADGGSGAGGEPESGGPGANDSPGPEGSILVDTGFLEGDHKKRFGDFKDYRRQRELLAPFGLEPSGARRVILTHLHWDHFSAGRLFPEAEFYLQKKEADFWRSPESDHHFLRHFLADMGDLDWLEEEGRINYLEGEAGITGGITVHPVGGHTPGLQVVRVRTAEGWAVLAADAAYVFRNLESMVPPGIHVRVEECLAALGTVKDLADKPTLIFPGHDIEIFNKFPEQYPGVRRLA